MNHELRPAAASPARTAPPARSSRSGRRRARPRRRPARPDPAVRDLEHGARRYNAPATGIALSRLCSADLPARSRSRQERSRATTAALHGRRGDRHRGPRVRARARRHELRAAARSASSRWENSVANPATGRETVVVGTDDTSPGQVYVYVGDKKKTGNPAELAGLTGGTLYGIKIPGIAVEPAGTGSRPGRAFTAARSATSRRSPARSSRRTSDAAGVTEWQRPEDGAWDPKHPNDLYFVVTASFSATASSTGCASTIRRTRPRAARRPAARRHRDGGTGERSTCSTTSPSTATGRSCSRRIRAEGLPRAGLALRHRDDT